MLESEYLKDLEKVYVKFTKNNLVPPERVFYRINDLLKRFTGKKQVIKILDASGGSEGKTVIFLAKKGYDIYYSEVDNSFVEKIQKSLVKINPQLREPKNRCVVSEFKDLPHYYSKNYFDGIISILTIHRGDWNYINQNFLGLTTILKKGGYMQLVFHKYKPKHTIFSVGFIKKVKVPCLDSNHPHNKYSFDFRDTGHKWRNEVFHLYTEYEIKELCNKYGLEIIILKDVKMFFEQTEYWYLLAKKNN